MDASTSYLLQVAAEALGAEKQSLQLIMGEVRDLGKVSSAWQSQIAHLRLHCFEYSIHFILLLVNFF